MGNVVFELKSIEEKLINDLQGKELWGDINITDGEYETLVRVLKEYIDGNDEQVYNLCSDFPVSLTTFLVNLARIEYNYNFWGLVYERLNFSTSDQYLQGTIGKCARNTFTKYGFDFSEADDGIYVYLNPIIFEAGLPPESNLGDLFYILSYDTYSIFDPYSIIDDLIESRSYAIRKPLLRFLKRYKDTRAVDFVLSVNDAIRFVDKNISGESQYVENYKAWLEEEKNKERLTQRKNRENQVRPYLHFDDGKKGLSMILPRTILADEWIDEIDWEITSPNGFEIVKRMTVFGDEDRRYINNIAVSISPDESYTVELVDEENLGDTKFEPYTVSGISKDKITFFDANGRMRNGNYLPGPSCTMIVPSGIEFDYNSCIVTRQAYPTDVKEYDIYSVDIIDGTASLNYVYSGKKLEYRVRPQIKMELVGNHIFDVDSNNLFTSIPNLELTIDDGVVVDDLILKINGFGRDIKLENSFENNVASISLPKSRFDDYGLYSLRLYQGENYLKQIEFFYVPKITSTYKNEIKWVDGADRNKSKLIKFNKKDGWEISFEDCIVQSDESTYYVDVPSGIGVLNGSLKRIEEDVSFSCNFELPILPFEAEIVDNYGQILDQSTEKISKIDFSEIIEDEKEFWLLLSLFGDYVNYEYKLQLKTINGVEQEYRFRCFKNGYLNINLSVFYDTLKNCPLPAYLSLVCQDLEKETLLISIKKSTKFLGYPNYPLYQSKGYIIVKKDDPNKDLVIRKLTTGESMNLSFDRVKVIEDKGVRAYPCKNKLTEGLYLIDVDDSINDIFDFDDSENDMTMSKDSTLIYVSSKKTENEFEYSNVIDKFIKAYMKDKLEPPYLFDSVDVLLTDADYEKLIILAALFNIENINQKKEILEAFMRKISIEVLSDRDRYNLLELLVECHVSQDIFDCCTQNYNLYLFSDNIDLLNLSDKVELYSNEIALLMKMKANDSIRNTIKKEKYRELIGKDSIKSMLIVDNEVDESLINLEKKKFLSEKECNVRIAITKDISGDFEPIQAMMVYDTKNPYMNMKKKPDCGIYFDHIRYIDQYLNWYKLNHSFHGEMKELTKDRMVSTQEKYAKDIINALNDLKKVDGYVASYEKVLKARYAGDPLVNLSLQIPARFFYLLGVAAILVSVGTDDVKERIEPAEKFLASSISFAPKMTRRDILLANTFCYLNRKGENLCR